VTMPIAFKGEVMLLGWRETHNGGAQVNLLLSDPDELAAFKRMTVSKGKVAGQRLACVLAEIHDEENTVSDGTRRDAAGAEEAGQGSAADSTCPAKSAPNELARKLHVDGYFRSGKLWAAMEAATLYSQKQHKEWIESQECLFRGQGVCQGDIVLHHCNSAAIPASGNADHPRKPAHWYGVPLCAITHHQEWAHASHGATREDKATLLEKAVALTADRMKSKIKDVLGIKSLREITPALLAEFEERIGL